MSVTSSLAALALGVCIAAGSVLPGCASFSGPSLVAQGKYYSSGNPQYDTFFIELYQAQVQMADAPRVPEAERQALALALGLSADTPADAVAQRLREAALKLGQSGLHMRLERKPSLEKPELASATLRATFRPKDDASVALLSRIEASATTLLRSAAQMQAARLQLDKLEVDAIRLDTNVPQAFAEAHVGKQTEVKRNLADGQKLIALMRVRGEEVRARSEQLLAAVSKAVDTDDGSLSATPAEAGAPPIADPKKAAPARVKPKAASSGPTISAPVSAAKPKPSPAPVKPKPTGGDDDAPAKPSAPSKPAPPARDFEP